MNNVITVIIIIIIIINVDATLTYPVSEIIRASYLFMDLIELSSFQFLYTRIFMYYIFIQFRFSEEIR